MLGKFVRWFIYFGLSFLVANVFGWTDQARAFLYIYIGVSVEICVISILMLLITGVAIREKLMMTGISFLVAISEIIGIAVMLFATWGATKLFGVDFFVTFQIMTFGACLVSESSRSKKDND